MPLMFVGTILAENKFKLNFRNLKLPIYGYSVIIALMVSKAFVTGITLLKSGAYLPGWEILTGSSLFVISDGILLFALFRSKRSKYSGAANAWTYFSAQALLAISVSAVGG